MSYVRFSGRQNQPHPYVSDLYIYEGSEGIVCCGCRLAGIFVAERDEPEPVKIMIDHVRLHQAAGHAVPDFVIPRLEEGRSFN